MLNVTHMAALLVRLLPLIHVLSQHHLVLRVSNIARAIKYKPNVQCWEKYPGASWGCCLPEVCFCYKEMRPGSTHQAVREGCSLGSERKSWVSLEICLILPPPPCFSPRAPRLCLCSRWQDTNQKWEWEWARLSVWGCAGSGGLWFQHMHLAFGDTPPLQPMLCVDSKGMIHPDKGAHCFFFCNAKHLLCKMWETRGKVHFFLIFGKNSLLLPTPCPILHSWDRDFPMRNFAFVT